MRGVRWMRAVVACGVLAVLAGCTVPAPTEGVRRPGDRFVYVDGGNRERIREVVEVGEAGVRWRTERGVTFLKVDPFTPMVEWDGRRTRGRTLALHVAGDLHPARKGSRRVVRIAREVIHKADGRREIRREIRRCRARGARVRTVPAGTFATFKVVCRDVDPVDGRVLRTWVWYWSPALGHWVERARRSADGRRQRLRLVRVEHVGPVVSTGP